MHLAGGHARLQGQRSAAGVPDHGGRVPSHRNGGVPVRVRDEHGVRSGPGQREPPGRYPRRRHRGEAGLPAGGRNDRGRRHRPRRGGGGG
ncbi:hypothetical protein SDC9_151110 [bioreactor metagenome]|uniref:Uncharacterized protein n=1 Tax=bioreactor metagenome TaxID=1076179 RepID=A0A645EPD3_9ZZZZ